MICPPCQRKNHWGCAYPESCCCSHKQTWPNGEVDQWSYKAVPVVFDGGRHGWLWEATHPEGAPVWFDRQGRKCSPRPGKTGIRLFYRAVDFGTLL